MIIGYRIRVKGMVQGVGYRFFCRNAAEKLGLSGFVKNMDDGDVLLEVYGEQNAINEFISEITRKDKMFSVVDIVIDDIEVPGSLSGFSIKLY